MDLAQSGTFVVESQPEGQRNAVLGGIMALRMKVLGVEGIIVHGRIRDLEELAATGLTVSLLLQSHQCHALTGLDLGKGHIHSRNWC